MATHAANTPALAVATVFGTLPEEIIYQILKASTPDGFASLVLLNQQWRKIAQQPQLYAYQLSRCPSYAAAHKNAVLSEHDHSLADLRRLFAKEIKRNVFPAYIHPRKTTIDLVSHSISLSSAPGGEAFQFSLSQAGRYVLVYSSSRIHVLDVATPTPSLLRELKISRLPAASVISDDGSTIAILSSDLQVNVYDLNLSPPRHCRMVSLDYHPRTIAISPSGSVLAAAYDAGIEVFSLEDDRMAVDRRAVKCYGVDALCFSKDGRQIIGTTSQSRSPSTVVLTAPYYDPISQLPEESLSTVWTTSILFPSGSRDCSHSVLLSGPHEEESSWTFTYDRIFETFRAVRVDDLRNGTTYFTGPISAGESKLVPSTLPAASGCGDLVSAGFGSEVWLYGLPEDLEALPGHGQHGVESEPGTPLSHRSIGRRSSAPSLHSVHRRDHSFHRIPQWQILCDKYRNNFVEGKLIANFAGVTAMGWVNSTEWGVSKQRLVLVSPGISQVAENEIDDMNPIDGGRMCLLDFGYQTGDGKEQTITIEVGLAEPELLEEEYRDMAEEVAILRRRTVAIRRSMHGNLPGLASSVPRPPAATSTLGSVRPPLPSVPDLSIPGHVLPNDLVETASVEDEQYALDDPYSHTDPRSAPTLRRAATAAAVNRRYNPRTVAPEYVTVRRADGREEHAHESDSDACNWDPPPPPYTKNALPPLPPHVQRATAVDSPATPSQRPATVTARQDEVEEPTARARTTSWSVSHEPITVHPAPARRSISDSTTMMRTSNNGGFEITRSGPSPVSPSFDELYDVSPPGTPRPGSRRLDVPQGLEVDAAVNVSPSSTRISLTYEGAEQPICPIPQTADAQMQPHILSWEQESEFGDDGPPSPVSVSSTARNTMEHLDEDIAPCLLEEAATHVPPSPLLEPVSTLATSLPAELPNSTVQHTMHPSVSSISTRSIPMMSDVPMVATPVEMQAAEVPLGLGTTPPQDSASELQAGEVTNLPSSEQIARLNSRRGRPPQRLLTDPARRQGAALAHNAHHRTSSTGSRRSFSDSELDARPRQRSTRGRPTSGAYSSAPQAVVTASTAFAYAETTAQMPQVSVERPSSRPYSSSSPRPVMPRLDTIQSIGTNPDSAQAPLPSAHAAMPTRSSPAADGSPRGLGRQTSRAKKKQTDKSVGDKTKTSWRRTLSVRRSVRRMSMLGGRGDRRGAEWDATMPMPEPDTVPPVPARPSRFALRAEDLPAVHGGAVEMDGGSTAAELGGGGGGDGGGGDETAPGAERRAKKPRGGNREAAHARERHGGEGRRGQERDQDKNKDKERARDRPANWKRGEGKCVVM